MQKIADEQEVMGALADMIIAVYTMESAILRAQKLGAKEESVPVAMAKVYAAQAMETIEKSARMVIAAVAEGRYGADAVCDPAKRLAKHDPADTIALRRQIAGHVIKAGKYGF